MSELYTCEQVASRYGVKISTVWSWIRENKLAAIRVGKQYRVYESALLSFENENKTS